MFRIFEKLITSKALQHGNIKIQIFSQHGKIALVCDQSENV